MNILGAFTGFIIFILGVLFLITFTSMEPQDRNKDSVAVTALITYSVLCSVGAFVVLLSLNML